MCITVINLFLSLYFLKPIKNATLPSNEQELFRFEPSSNVESSFVGDEKDDSALLSSNPPGQEVEM